MLAGHGNDCPQKYRKGKDRAPTNMFMLAKRRSYHRATANWIRASLCGAHLVYNSGWGTIATGRVIPIKMDT